MNNSLNIISKLNFEKSTEGNLSTTYNDENKYSSIVWSQISTPKITSVNGVKVLNISTAPQRIQTQTLTHSKLIKDDNFQVEVDIELLELNIENAYFGFTVNYNKNIAFSIRNSFNKGLIISCGAVEIYCNYQFNKNTRYNIIVSKKESEYSFMINGEAAGYVISEAFTNAISTSTVFTMVLGAGWGTSTDAMRNGNIYGLNVSIGTTFKYNAPFTEYGNNLVSSLRFGNASLNSTATSIASGIETIKDAKTWQFNSPISVSNEYLINNTTSFVNNIDSNYTLDFSIKNTKPLDNVNLFVNGPYTVKYTFIKIGQPEPQVIVNENTTSALDFENGIVDKVSTTVWTKEGTANVTSINKIFGENSFETKVLGDGLSTTSKLITGGGTPYTIEFYALIKSDNLQTSSGFHPILTSKHTNGSGGGSQGLYLNKTTNQFMYQRTTDVEPNFGVGGNLSFNNNKIAYNEINKITITFDGVALRFFINDALDYVIGTLNGHYIRTFFHLYSHPAAFDNTTKGIIDNINIHDGIATKVRDYDPYEEFLVVDLALDGENNSKKIVDNGNVGNTWTVYGNAKLSTSQKFDGFSSLHLDGSSSIYTQTTDNHVSFNRNSIFTMSFDYICTVANTSTKVLVQFFNNSSQRISLYMHSLKNLKLYYSGALRFDINIPTIEVNTPVNYRFIWDKGTIYLYINNVLVHSYYENYDMLDGYPFRIYLGESGTSSEFFYGYIKNFKIYKDVAIIPENPTGKIQLDFDNNVTDKYGNSTWANNGVTFDQVNSVKGHAAYFNGSYKYIQQSNYTFDDSNIQILFDMKKTSTLNNSILISNNLAYSLSIDNNGYILLKDKMITNNAITLNNYYNHEYIGKNNLCLYKLNNVIVGQSNNNISRIWDGFSIGSTSSGFNGYIDNFKSIKDSQEPVIIDKPAVHLPLETNAINTGFTPLTINSVGSPTYTTIDGKKCIKFESGKYLTINSNNIFNLGTSSDFYIEMRIYVNNYTLPNRIFASTLNSENSRIGLGSASSNYYKKLYINAKDLSDYPSINECLIDHWNDIKIYRKNQKLTIFLNGVISEYDVNQKEFDFSSTCIGGSPTTYFDGYMSNFKMFVGASEIPETYNDKKVLDLDFKPTGKSYLFKDNNNKCVIHPVNITQRDYQNSKYCCSFNGNNQYLQLGKNELLNFGNDDFVINIKFKYLKRGDNSTLMSGNITSNIGGYWYIQVRSEVSALYSSHVEFTYRIDSNNVFGIRHNIPLIENEIYDLIIIRNGNSVSMSVNGDVDYTLGDDNINATSFNLNGGGNTYIGVNSFNFTNSTNWKLYGTIYSIKVLRNTTDLTLLEDGSEVPAQIEEKFVLSNGVDEEIISYESNEPRNIRIVKDETKASLIIDGEAIEVPTVENTDSEITLFDGYTGDIKDLKLYNAPLYSEDRFLGSEMIDTQFGEAEIDELSDDYELYMGDFKIKGFIEGYTDRKFVIYDSINDTILYNGIEDYEYNNLDENHIEYYFIKDLINNQTYPVNKHEMIKGYISGTVNLKQCGVKANDMEVYCYKSDTFRHIGTYLVDNNGRYNIPNLDVNTRYDIIFRDKTRRIKDQISNYRKPVIY